MVRLVWFRNDLRVTDQTALASAARDGTVVAVWCLCPEQLRAHDVGGNRIAFALRCLRALQRELADLGIPLRVLAPADFAAVPDALLSLAREIGADSLWFNDEYPLNERRRDRAVTSTFDAAGLDVGLEESVTPASALAAGSNLYRSVTHTTHPNLAVQSRVGTPASPRFVTRPLRSRHGSGRRSDRRTRRAASLGRRAGV
jgi:deoxyribodipyrimidine photo-lyase